MPDNKNIALYIHWPFCVSKCPYCDFNSFVAQDVNHREWLDAYKKELEYYYELTKGKIVTSIFFGGGTPSLMQPFVAEGVIDKIVSLWGICDDVEVSLEANPSSVEYDKFIDFAAAGINRVSIGVQSFDDRQLAFLGRKHSAEDAIKAIKIAAKSFDRYSFDLIYALPEQTACDWKKSLDNALSYAGGHISVYQLTIEKGTDFYTKYRRGDFTVLDDDCGGVLYEITQSIMEQYGLPSYEISNHAKKGEESKHNMTYWRYGDYIGVGPGAHGRFIVNGEKIATKGHRAPDIWIKKVNKTGCGSHEFEVISRKDRAIEALMMGLRLKEGIPLSRIELESGSSWKEIINPDKMENMIKEGFVSIEEDVLIPSSKAIQRLDSLLGYLLTE